DRGVGQILGSELAPHPKLQWVHGPRTVVSPCSQSAAYNQRFGFNGSTVRGPWCRIQLIIQRTVVTAELQWVHGPRTVVSKAHVGIARHAGEASMGPRSEDRGVAEAQDTGGVVSKQLQWVHGPRTVVSLSTPSYCSISRRLQWVHGPRTVVSQAA